MIDWTQVLVVVGPYVVGHAFGALQMWLRLRRDAELGRSLRPPRRPPRRPALPDLHVERCEACGHPLDDCTCV